MITLLTAYSEFQLKHYLIVFRNHANFGLLLGGLGMLLCAIGIGLYCVMPKKHKNKSNVLRNVLKVTIHIIIVLVACSAMGMVYLLGLDADPTTLSSPNVQIYRNIKTIKHEKLDNVAYKHTTNLSHQQHKAIYKKYQHNLHLIKIQKHYDKTHAKDVRKPLINHKLF